MRERATPLRQRIWPVLAAPWLWFVLFFALPFAFVVKLSVSQSAVAQPPYVPAFAWTDSWSAIAAKLNSFSLESYRTLITDNLYLDSFLSSLGIAAASTCFALLIVVPFALAIVRAPRAWRPALMALAIAPFWTSFLIRIYAWILLLKDEGLFNQALLALGIIAQPLPMFATTGAVIAGIVYAYMPLMLLPVVAVLERQDEALIEAASDLGASPLRVFFTITLPLALPGIGAGALLVFIPAIGEYIIPDLLGGSQTLTIGRTIWTDFFDNRDWPAASTSAVALLVLLVGPLLLCERALARRAAVP